MQYLYTFLLFLLLQAAQSQDLQFAQFYAVPMFVNAAATGHLEEGSQRITIAYRGQWDQASAAGPYQGALAAYEYRHCQKHNFWALGGWLQSEGARFANYRQGQVKLSGAFHYQLGQDFYASVGLGGGALQYGAALSDLRYDAQFAPGQGYDPHLATGENLEASNTRWQPDLNTGAQIYNPRQGWVFGAALSHLNRPNFSILGKDNFLGVGLSVHGTATIRTTSRQAFVLRGLTYRQSVLGSNSAQWQTLLGGFYRMTSRGEGLFSAGCLLRLSGNTGRHGPFEALVPTVQLGAKQLRFGLSYDLNLRKLVSPSLGRVELTMGWTFGEVSHCVVCSEF